MKTTVHTILFALILGLTSIACSQDELVSQTDQITGSDQTVSGRPYFELWKTNTRYYFHLNATNHQIILTSQSYSSRTAALNGVLSVLDNAGNPERFDLLEADNGEYYFNLKAGNGKIIGTSELYSTKSNATAGIAAVDRAVGDYLAFLATRTGARFVVKETSDGRYHFVLNAANGAIVLQSQTYSTEAAALNGTFSVADNGVDEAAFDIRQSQNDGFYFNLKASNGQIIATGEVYFSKYNAERARDSIIALLPSVELL
jgi:uncharacterized protein YegP (UPF0339 family)